MKKALIVAAMLAAGPAMAQTQDDYVPYQGFYIGAGGGAVWALSSNPGVTTYTGWVAGGKIGYDFIGPRLD
ncbi:MAG: hypothetical protein Q8K93_02995, partial [Reyranella sp.]|nr:hypothetical protein [Reyranella sp.]